MRNRGCWGRVPTSRSITAPRTSRRRRTRNVVAYYNLDNGTGKIRGIWGQGNLGAMALFRQWIESVRDLGVEFVGPRSVGATDHASFDGAGIPGFQFMQERLEYNSRIASLQHGFRRSRAARGSRSAGGRRRRVRVVHRELAREAAAKGGSCAPAGYRTIMAVPMSRARSPRPATITVFSERVGRRARVATTKHTGKDSRTRPASRRAFCFWALDCRRSGTGTITEIRRKHISRTSPNSLRYSTQASASIALRETNDGFHQTRRTHPCGGAGRRNQ